MKIVYFLTFIFAIIWLLMWFTRKQDSEIELAQRKKRKERHKAKKLLAVPKEASPHRYEIWHSQRPRDERDSEEETIGLVPSETPADELAMQSVEYPNEESTVH